MMMKVLVAAALAVATLAASVQGAAYWRLVTYFVRLNKSCGLVGISSCRRNAWMHFG